MIPSYNPPYDSPIEDSFAYNMVKYIDPEAKLIPQYKVHTICGNFVIDFLCVTSDGKKIGIECDGKEFHDDSRDEWRDAMILGDEKVDSIYRFRGCEITYSINEILYIFSLYEPMLFSSRGRSNIKLLCNEQLHNVSLKYHDGLFLREIYDSDIDNYKMIYIEHRHRNIPKNKRAFWQACYSYAKKIGGGNIDMVISSYRSDQNI